MHAAVVMPLSHFLWYQDGCLCSQHRNTVFWKTNGQFIENHDVTWIYILSGNYSHVICNSNHRSSIRFHASSNRPIGAPLVFSCCYYIFKIAAFDVRNALCFVPLYNPTVVWLLLPWRWNNWTLSSHINYRDWSFTAIRDEKPLIRIALHEI